MRTSYDSLTRLFADPPVAYRGKPFWAWNGHLDREELLRQIRVFAEMGMGGFFMHSRTGLRTPYLGEEWFELVNACADEAERLGLEAWLYDEDRWPSGSAGGLATVEPRYRMKVLRLRIVTPGPIEWPSREAFIAAFTAEVDGLAIAHSRPLQYGAESDGRSVLLFTTETWSGQSFYNGFTYLDTLSREATEHFIALTHEKYRQRCGARLGKTIRGIFTDEPHHGTVLCENNENRAMADQRWTLPWTERLWAEFESKWGYDLRTRLPDLFLQADGKRIAAVKWQYMELIQRMFLENWAKPLHDWCRQHGLQLTGHLLHEDSLVAQAVPCGSVMRGYEYFDIPGIDVLGLDNRNFCGAKQLASVGRQLDRKWLLSELYGCTGWQLDFAGHKRIGLWQALLGVNVRCHHLAWYTMEGEAKRDYPASISFQSPWWREYRAVEDFFSRLNVILDQGERVAEVLVINPIESTWAQIYPGWAQWLGAVDAEIGALEQKYRDVFTWLSTAQIDFDYGDEEHVARLGAVEAIDGQAHFRVGKARYSTVVVAGLKTIRQSTLEALQRFRAAGGAVIFAGEAPGYVNAEPSSKPAEFAATTMRVPFTKPALIAAVAAQLESRIAVGLAGEADGQHVLMQVRHDEDRMIVAIGNHSASDEVSNVTFRAHGAWRVEEWECNDGGQSGTPNVKVAGDETTWQTTLPPLGLRVFVLGPHDSHTHPSVDVEEPTETQELAGPFAYELDEPNVCVLDFAEWRISNGGWEQAREILQIDAVLRDRLGFPQRSGVMVQPWATQPPAVSDEPGVPIALRFRFEVGVLPKTPIHLLLERPERATLTVNGRRLGVPAETEWHIDPCLRRVPVPLDMLRPGVNDVLFATRFCEHRDLEAVYLLGSFGVVPQSDMSRLIALPDRLKIGDVCSQGLPFYSGKIRYRLPVGNAIGRHRRAQLVLGQFGGACARVRSRTADEETTIAWPPFSADVTDALRDTSELIVELTLTRRNTFGPLHLVPRGQPAIGPMSFRSDGATFSKDYVLEPAGLLQTPMLTWSGTKSKAVRTTRNRPALSAVE